LVLPGTEGVLLSDGCRVCRSIQRFLDLERKRLGFLNVPTATASTHERSVLLIKDHPDPATKLENVLGISLHSDSQDAAHLLVRSSKCNHNIDNRVWFKAHISDSGWKAYISYPRTSR
jgi:hypothetical protein